VFNHNLTGDIEMMKKTLLAAAMLTTSSAVFAEISANVTLASDYVFRGISQTDNQLAIQGGFDYAWDNGFYVGTWASNVDPDFFNGTGHDPQAEVDLYGGYSGEYNDFGYDVGYLRYEYPGYGKADTNEVYVSGTYKWLTVSVNYSDELAFLPSNQSAWYFKTSLEHTLPWYEIGISTHVGHSFGDAFDISAADIAKGDSGLSDSYTDWSIGLTKSWMGADFGLTYTDLNIDDKDCDDSQTDICDTKFVASISKSF
jgi:uncharacterized protein (TIGR02001 family)